MRAVIVVDVQEKYTARYANCTFIENINFRTRKASENGEFVIYVKNSPKLKGKEGLDFDKRLEMCSQCTVTKDTADVFKSTDISKILAQNGVSEVEVVGIDGCCCVAATASGALANGFATYLNLQCVATINERRYEKKLEKLKNDGVKVI